jgi:hypothetical protein
MIYGALIPGSGGLSNREVKRRLKEFSNSYLHEDEKEKTKTRNPNPPKQKETTKKGRH